MNSQFFPIRVIIFCKSKVCSIKGWILKKLDYPEGSMPLGSIKHKWITHLGGIEIDAFHPKKLFLSGKNKGYYLPKERMVPNPLAPRTLYPRPDPNFFKGVNKVEYMNHKSKYTGFEYKVERWQIEQIMKKKFGDPETVIISAASLHIPQCIAKPCGKYVKPFLKMV